MKEIAEDLLKLIYAYQDMHSKLGITSDQSPSVSRAEEWIAAQQCVQRTATSCAVIHNFQQEIIPIEGEWRKPLVRLLA